MSKQVRLRRGTTTQHATFTGVQGEITFDTDKNCLVVHDGVTAGGSPIDKAVLMSGDSDALQTINTALKIKGAVGTVGLVVDKDTLCSGYFSAQNGAQLRGETDLHGPLSLYNSPNNGTGGQVILNLAFAPAITVALSGNTTFTTVLAYLANGRTFLAFITADGSARNLTWPADWKWLGSAAPTSIAANKTALLELWCLGTTNADILARWTVQP